MLLKLSHLFWMSQFLVPVASEEPTSRQVTTGNIKQNLIFLDLNPRLLPVLQIRRVSHLSLSSITIQYKISLFVQLPPCQKTLGDMPRFTTNQVSDTE